jgi:hypothetical protein
MDEFLQQKCEFGPAAVRSEKRIAEKPRQQPRSIARDSTDSEFEPAH